MTRRENPNSKFKKKDVERHGRPNKEPDNVKHSVQGSDGKSDTFKKSFRKGNDSRRDSPQGGFRDKRFGAGNRYDEAPVQVNFESILEARLGEAKIKSLVEQSRKALEEMLRPVSKIPVEGAKATPQDLLRTLPENAKGSVKVPVESRGPAESPAQELAEPLLPQDAPKPRGLFAKMSNWVEESFGKGNVDHQGAQSDARNELSAKDGLSAKSELRSDRGFRSGAKQQASRSLEGASGKEIPSLASLIPTKQKTFQKVVVAEVLEPDAEVRYSSSGSKLDPWQAKALDYLMAGDNLIVDAPTSAGKTRVIEALLEEKMKIGVRLVYTSPVKSLSNDKYREFCEKYGKDRVGINTGDFKENLGAPFILATLETYRNSLLGVEPNMQSMVIVYDEYHFLQDESRGSAWEESIILTPPESQLVLLSASVPNADDFAAWIKKIKGRPCQVIRVEKRPVPLVDLVYTKYGWILGSELNLFPQDILELRKMSKLSSQNRRRTSAAKRFQELLEPVRAALTANLGPVVIYAGRRGDVEGIAQAISRGLKGGEDPHFNHEKLRTRIENLPGWDYVPTELQRLIKKHGIAYHHSGMIPPGRVAIESLLKEGLLRVCTGTMGISLGVNFAVRSALVADETRPSENGEVRYSNTEVMQMLGRAGRRGHDKQGFSLWMDLGRFAIQKPLSREPCRSSLKFDPTTVLGILGQHESFSYLSDFYVRSFFMQQRDPKEVMLEDHDVVTAILYKEGFGDSIGCKNISDTYTRFHQGKQRTTVECQTCLARPGCHKLVAQARKSVLYKIVRHLQTVGALKGPQPTPLGQLARHFPQAGGLIIASWLASGQMHSGNFQHYVQAMAVFCSAHFKEIPDMHVDLEFLRGLRLPKLIEQFYPEGLFPDLYDEVSSRGDTTRSASFREFNYGAASIVRCWLGGTMSWEDLVSDHTSKFFSAGDCMMVLFRFSTFLQSCSRLTDFDPQLARQAKSMLKILLREPLDARNRMLAEETDEFEAIPAPEELPPGTDPLISEVSAEDSSIEEDEAEEP